MFLSSCTGTRQCHAFPRLSMYSLLAVRTGVTASPVLLQHLSSPGAKTFCMWCKAASQAVAESQSCHCEVFQPLQARAFPFHHGHQQTWGFYNYTVEQIRRFHLFLMENYVAPSGSECLLKEGLQLWAQ